eukprot:99144_1
MSDCEINICRSYIFVIVLFTIYTYTSASYIDIINPGFETNCYPLDGSNGHVCWEDPIGWSAYWGESLLLNERHGTYDARHTFLGHINPLGDLQYMNGGGASEGIQSLFVSVSPEGFGTVEFGITQRLSTVAASNTVYTLSVDIGNPKIWGNEYHKGWCGASIYLLAGDHVLGRRSILSLDDGMWTTAKLVVTVTDVNEEMHVGQALGIRLTNLNEKNIDENPSLNEVLFDNVRLEAVKMPVKDMIMCRYWGAIYTMMLISASLVAVIGLIEICKSDRFENVIVSIYKYEEKIMMFINSIYETFFYTRCYEYNRRAPKILYELNMKYDNSGQCTVCFRKYKKVSHRKEDILHCGHRFHAKCLRKWELQQFKQNAFKSYRCPVCRTSYHWKQKWRYVQD